MTVWDDGIISHCMDDDAIDIIVGVSINAHMFLFVFMRCNDCSMRGVVLMSTWLLMAV